MGNRAVITLSNKTERAHGVGIYLHWNGGIESILAFLHVCKKRDYRSPGSDPVYAMARLCGVLHEFFGPAGSTGLGMGPLSALDCDNYDNGVFVIGGDWEIVDRWGAGSRRERTAAHLSPADVEKMHAIVESLDESLTAWEFATAARAAA